MGINDFIHTRKSFVAVAVVLCEWAFSEPECTDQSQAAGADHYDDEGLEVFVLDEFVHVAPECPPALAGLGVDERVAALGSHAARRTALVRVLYEHHVHLREQQKQI